MRVLQKLRRAGQMLSMTIQLLITGGNNDVGKRTHRYSNKPGVEFCLCHLLAVVALGIYLPL